jgi:hypothetical protein
MAITTAIAEDEKFLSALHDLLLSNKQVGDKNSRLVFGNSRINYSSIKNHAKHNFFGINLIEG